MTRNIVVVGSAVFIALWFGYAWAEPQMNPGKWEITTKTEMTGLPTHSMTHTQCITSDDQVPVSTDDSSECEITDVKTSGDTVSWKMTCRAEGGGMDGVGQVTYKGDSMQGTMTMTMRPQGTQMKNTFSGRRIGECDGSSTTSPVPSQSAVPAAYPGTATVGADDNDPGDAEEAARDEAKTSVVDEVRQGVKGAVRSLFK